MNAPQPRRFIEVYPVEVQVGVGEWELNWRWRLKSANGRVMASGQAHPDKAGATHAALEATGHQTQDTREVTS